MTPVVLLALRLLQAPGFDVTTSVDPPRLKAGEQLTFTIRVRTPANATPVIDPLALEGFTVLGSREVTEVSLGGAEGSVRTFTRDLSLRAARPGIARIGAVRVRVGDAVRQSAPITVVVDSADAFPATALTPQARTLLEAAPPPRRADEVALRLYVPAETVLVGQQVDVVLAAWVPRDVNQRLHGRPVLTLHTPPGVWAYPPSAPADVALSRRVAGKMMDLYAVHQVLFPVTPGRAVIPPALLEYAVLVSFSYFSREERYSLTGDSVALTVLPLPAAGRPTDDQAVVADDLSLAIDVTPPDARVGEPLDVAATLRGIGNVDLWPAPTLRWPPGFRVYPGETSVQLEPAGGRVAGTKAYHFLIVPDSAGTFLLPEVRYPHFQLAKHSYRTIQVAPRSLVVGPGVEPRPARALPPLLPPVASGWAERVAGTLGVWGWLAVLLLPPLLVVPRLWRRAPREETLAATAAQELTRLGRLEQRFQRALVAHVPDAIAREGGGLTQALRAAGLERGVADHVTRLRDRLRAARYGPRGSGAPAELAAELEQVLRVLTADTRRGARRDWVGVAAVLLAVGAATTRLAAQATSAEVLYRAGALRAAADSFAARAGDDSLEAAHWYNLGATLYRAGADGKAVAAWTEAAQLAPRNRIIRRARPLLPPTDPTSEDLLAVDIATPAEWAVVAGAAWLLCWLVVWRRGRRLTALVFGVVALAAGTRGYVDWRRSSRPVALVVAAQTAVRAAPYGRASTMTTVEPGAALLVIDSYAGGRWLRVRRGDLSGWILASDLVRL